MNLIFLNLTSLIGMMITWNKISDKLKIVTKEVRKIVDEARKEDTYYIFPVSEFDGYEHPQDHKYTKQQLNEDKPKGIKRSRCELYLEDNEFKLIFKMTKEDFYKLKDWKRLRLKKDNNLW